MNELLFFLFKYFTFKGPADIIIFFVNVSTCGCHYCTYDLSLTIWMRLCENIILLLDLLLHITYSNLTEGNETPPIPDLRPLFEETGVILTGDPTTIACPVGKGIRLTNNDHTIYKFSVSNPWPCPFNINQCLNGFTLSFWFQWHYYIISNTVYYITLGTTFRVYRPSTAEWNLISLRWNVARKFSWFCGLFIDPNEWTLITWKVNNTDSVCYVNGLKYFEKSKERRNFRSGIINKLHFNENRDAGNFSVGPIQMWAGGKSPVFIWSMFQLGLDDYDQN